MDESLWKWLGYVEHKGETSGKPDTVIPIYDMIGLGSYKPHIFLKNEWKNKGFLEKQVLKLSTVRVLITTVAALLSLLLWRWRWFTLRRKATVSLRKTTWGAWLVVGLHIQKRHLKEKKKYMHIQSEKYWNILFKKHNTCINILFEKYKTQRHPVWEIQDIQKHPVWKIQQTYKNTLKNIRLIQKPVRSYS